MTRKIISVPPLCKVSEDAGRTYYEIEQDGPSDKVEIWWDLVRSGIEVLLVRQETPGIPMADVLMLTQAQVYALIDALNRAVMSK